ncbi:MAG: hypothetical protein WBG65_14145 [Sulfurimonadaceae bacterium]
MKTFILLAIPFIVFASSETMHPLDKKSLHDSNHRPSIKLKKKMRLHQLHKVNENQAETIVKELTGENSISLLNTHSDNYLIYKVTTKHNYLVINALNATVIKQQLKEGM